VKVRAIASHAGNCFSRAFAPHKNQFYQEHTPQQSNITTPPRNRCQPGFTGKLCLTDIDECKFLPCKNGATCINQLTDFTCTCPSGWSGLACQTSDDDCVVNGKALCRNGAKCTDGHLSAVCTCIEGDTHTHTQTHKHTHTHTLTHTHTHTHTQTRTHTHTHTHTHRL
jgi:hypothetical protein